MYRCYCNGVEFGLDYLSLPDARKALAAYKKHFPKLKYYIRKIRRKRLSVLISK